MTKNILLVSYLCAACCEMQPVLDGSRPDAGRDPVADEVDAGSPVDDGDRPDAGAVNDAGGTFDAGESPDSGVQPLEDSGFIDDAGLPAVDAGVLDADLDAGLVDAGVDAMGCLPGLGVGAAFRVRAMAANLSSGNGQSYPNPGPGQRIVAGMNPDIVMVQEFNTPSNSEAEVRALADSMTNNGFSYFRGTGQIPNGILSRWPIVMSGEWIDPQVGNRTFAYVKINLPGPRDLWVVSVHLLTSGTQTLSAPQRRSVEARALVSKLQMNVPPEDFVMLGGDFNADDRTEPCFSDLSAVFVTSGSVPVDQAGNSGTNANRNKPYDQVLASACLQTHQVPVQVGTNQFPGGLVVDTRVYMPLGDLTPALQSDSAASMMQHMGVVKDFVIQP
jgi:endonuclease/exonuclease/phosphatase family metal-dependent hydrolase